jgi:hypothetical protein
MTLTLSEMALVEGGSTPNKVIGITCAVAGIASAVTGFFTLGFGWAVGSAIVGGFCSGYGLAAALEE